MNEDAFNMSIRKFLKTLGVTAQREIEQAVREALASGRLDGVEKLDAVASIVVRDAELELEVKGEIMLE